MAWRITLRRPHETRSSTPGIMLHGQEGNAICGAKNGGSGRRPETRSSAPEMAAQSGSLKRETRRAGSRVAKRETRRGVSLFQAASSR